MHRPILILKHFSFVQRDAVLAFFDMIMVHVAIFATAQDKLPTLCLLFNGLVSLYDTNTLLLKKKKKKKKNKPMLFVQISIQLA